MRDLRRPAKFAPRPLGPSQIERRRLLELLERQTHARFVLIQAPAGYGKTTLMTQWHRRLTGAGHGTGWIWLDDDDNDVARLGTALGYALAPDRTEIGDLLDSVNHCAHLHQHFTLFLDEAESLVSAEAIHLLETLHELSPASVHLVIGTRQRPQQLSARLRVQDDFLEVTTATLAFDTDEIARFMQLQCHVELEPATNRQLAHRTEGWPAALQLAAVEVTKGEPPETVCAHLSAPQSDLFRYLSEEVLAQLPPLRRDFLLQTSFLHELTGPLCDAVTARTDSEQVLQEMQRMNLLLQPLDISRRRFRYHFLFAELLGQMLRAEQPDALPLLARRASEWCSQQQLPQDAVEYALLSSSTELMVVRVEACIESLVARAQFATVKRWLAALPLSALKQRPALLTWAGWAHLWTSDFAAARQVLESCDQLGDDIALKERLGHSMLRALLAILQYRFDEAEAALSWAWQHVPDTNRTLMVRLLNLRALIEQVAGRFDAASDHARRARVLAVQSPPLWISSMHAAHVAGCTELALGHPTAAWRHFQEPERALAEAKGTLEPDVSPAQLLALLCGAKALVLYELNQIDDAEDCLVRHEPMLSSVFSPSGRMLGYQLRARLCLLRDDDKGCLNAIEQGSAYAAHHVIGWMAALMKWERINYELFRGDRDRARAIAATLLDDTPLNAAPQWIMTCEEVFGATIHALRFFVHSGQPQRALEHLPVHIAHAERQLRRLRLTKLRVLQALAYADVGDRASALRAMRAAVELGRLSGVIRTFADEGSRCWELLLELGRTSAPDADVVAYMQRLQGAFAGVEDISVQSPANPPVPAGVSATLSSRERQLLRRLAQGHSNLAMSQQLFLSPNTVKWHLSQLYSKLGVRNRTQAVHIAQQQRLL